MARYVTIAELRTQARQRADMENTQFVSDSELLAYINSSLAELYDLLIEAFEDYYAVPAPTITLVSTSDIYTLPSDFYKVLGVDFDSSTNFQNSITLRAFNFAERNRSSFYGQVAAPRVTDLQYHIQGNVLRFIPRPAATGFVRVWYVPAVRKLKDLLTNTDKPNGYSYSFTASEVDTTADTITITNHGYRLGDRINFSNVGGGLPAPIPTGTDLYAIPVTDNTFRIAASVSDAYQNTYYDITAAGTGTHYINDDQDKFDGMNGYEEFVIWDVAMRMKSKEESDVMVEMAEKQRIIKRIAEAASNRDIGENWRTIDVHNINDREVWE